MKLMLFCVESNKQKQVDWIYIRSLLRNLFVEDKSITIRPIFMNGRSNYDSNKVRREILSWAKRGYESVTVVLCVDTDYFETKADQKKELEGIGEYCKQNNYEFVWFCHDIEEVLIGHSVADSEKVACATNYERKEQYKTVETKRLTGKKYLKGSSNFISVLEKYYKLKESL